MKAIILALTLCAVTASDLFTNGPIRTIRIEIAEAGIESLRKQPRRDVLASVSDGETTITNATAHLKGQGTFQPIGDKRPSFTLEFPEPYANAFRGLRKFHLNNSKHDPTLLCEQIGGELFRSVGVPAAMAAHCTVNFNGKILGVYVLKEGFDELFLAQHFDYPEGKIYEHQHPLRLLKLRFTSPPDGIGFNHVETHLDVERFTSMLATETLIQHWDGYSYAETNYKVWEDKSDGRIQFFPHGMDNIFNGGPGWQGLKPFPQADTAQAFLSTERGRALYEKRLREIFTNHFQLEPLTNRVLELAKPIRAEIERVEGRVAADAHDGHVDRLVKRIANRWHDVDRQLKL